MSSQNLEIDFENVLENNNFSTLNKSIGEEIKKNEHLQKQCIDCQKTSCYINLELFMLEQHLNHFKENEQALEKCHEIAFNAYKSTLETSLYFNLIKHQNIVQCEEQKLKLKMSEESKELQDRLTLKKDTFERMEQRHIVQNLRKYQHELQILQNKEKSMNNKKVDILKQIENIIIKRNICVVQMATTLKSYNDKKNQCYMKNSYNEKILTKVLKKTNIVMENFGFFNNMNKDVIKYPMPFEKLMNFSLSDKNVHSLSCVDNEKDKNKQVSILRKMEEKRHYNNEKSASKRVIFVNTESTSSDNSSNEMNTEIPHKKPRISSQDLSSNEMEESECVIEKENRFDDVYLPPGQETIKNITTIHPLMSENNKNSQQSVEISSHNSSISCSSTELIISPNIIDDCKNSNATIFKTSAKSNDLGHNGLSKDKDILNDDLINTECVEALTSCSNSVSTSNLDQLVLNYPEIAPTSSAKCGKIDAKDFEDFIPINSISIHENNLNYKDKEQFLSTNDFNFGTNDNFKNFFD